MNVAPAHRIPLPAAPVSPGTSTTAGLPAWRTPPSWRLPLQPHFLSASNWLHVSVDDFKVKQPQPLPGASDRGALVLLAVTAATIP